MEAKVLSLMPVVIIVALCLMSPKYMKPLYSTMLGKILIILGFVLLVINYFIGKKIMDIDV